MLTRAIRPPSENVTPNPNDPAAVPPGTVGYGSGAIVPGDPSGVVVEGDSGPGWVPPTIVPSPWSGWPAEWATPLWGRAEQLAGIAWTCVDLNANQLATMPPYLVNAAPTLSADWLRNPNPDIYTSWEEFAKQLFWDFQLGEAFVIVTARYATGFPVRFHVVPPWAIEVDIGPDGLRRYKVGSEDVTADVLHIRYQSSVSDARGHGPLEAGGASLVAARVLARYATNLAAGGGIPPGVLKTQRELNNPDEAYKLQQQWMEARARSIGAPAVLSGGVTWEPTSVNPTEMALLDLVRFNESRIAVMLGVPPFLVGLPSGGDPMTYSNVSSIFDYHWRAMLRPRAAFVMSALSEWLLPRGTRVEVNRDAYVEPDPYTRAQTDQLLNSIQDENGNPALTVQEIRQKERLDNSTPSDLASGVLR